MRGLVYKIERFAIHDGPGIRTLVLMKGCPIRCLWCSSPQSQKATPEILHIKIHCRKCGRCIEVCPIGALTFSEEDGPKIDRELCTSCAQCVEACPNRAWELVGTSVTVEELFQEVKKDVPFYRRSNGGVTVGGGEPMMQYEFVAEFLKKCKQQYIHTCIETCAYGKWEHLEKLLKYLDLIYIDIKHMDPLVHRELTGVSNERILENARKASALCPMIIRIPTVPGYNDSGDNILATAKFAAELGENLKRVELLPYHKLGKKTYNWLSREYKLDDVEPPSDSYMGRLEGIVEHCGVRAKIGG